MPVLGVAGCSYMAATQDLDRDDCLANSHFTELLAQEMGWDYYTLARGGASNFCISYQVQQLIDEKVDLALIGFTSIDRDDIPLNLNALNFNIFDFNYYNSPDLSALDTRFSKKPLILSTSISTILQASMDSESSDLEDYFKYTVNNGNTSVVNSYTSYFKDLYNHSVKYHKDLATIVSIILRLEESKIPYLFYSTFCLNEWLESRKGFIPSTDKAVPWNYDIPETGALRYHTTAETQEEIKKYWYPYIAKFFPENFPTTCC